MRYERYMKLVGMVVVVVLFCSTISTPRSLGDEITDSHCICFEDFEDVVAGTGDPIPECDPTGTGEISRAGRPFYGRHGSQCDGQFLAEGGNPDQCAMCYIQMQYIDGDSYTGPKWRFDDTVGGSQELYLKFDLRIDEDLGDRNDETNEIHNFKFTVITDLPTAADGLNGWNPVLNVVPGTSSYSWYTWSQDSAYSEYYFHRATTKLTNHAYDHNWHSYEVYFHVGSTVVEDKYDESADGIIRIWEDSILILEDMNVPYRCSDNEGREINSVGFIKHAKHLGSPVENMEGHLYFDNIEVWDGMPHESGDTIPPQITMTNPANGDIVSGTITISADVTDNVGVDRVEFLVDDVLRGTDTSSPYECLWDSTDVENGMHVLRITACDTSNNQVSEELSVQVQNQGASGYLEARLLDDSVVLPLPIVLQVRFTNTGLSGTFRLSLDFLRNNGALIREDARVRVVSLAQGENVTYGGIMIPTVRYPFGHYILRVQAEDVYGLVVDELSLDVELRSSAR
ncbi:MAG: hypothetical protein JXA00_01065 [Candidatus Thermoplasmatota archaeon]|nr:hypothetical protein [Candidatus Thermoplasmatota archaeon]